MKLEGARLAGFQTVTLVLIRDPRYVQNVSAWCSDIARRCRSKVVDRLGLAEQDFTLELRVIGREATLGGLETAPRVGSEVGVLGIVTARTEELAGEIAKLLDPYLLHHPLTQEEEQPTFAFPFSPAQMSRGAVYEFCLNHVLELADPMEAYRLTADEIGA